MGADGKLRRIGIADQSSSGWAAGGAYTRQLADSLSPVCLGEGIELFYFSQNPEERRERANYTQVHLPAADPLPGEQWMRRRLGLPTKKRPVLGEHRLRRWCRVPSQADVFAAAARHGVSVLLAVLDIPPWRTPVKTVGWIPDFQHVYLPQYFAPGENRSRNETFHRLAEQADLVMLSSQTALGHYRTFAPVQAEKGRVVQFPSRFATMEFPEESLAVLEKYHLPRKFALISNQFWAHKNHTVVVEALARLRRERKTIPVVMTGLPADPRDPSNRYLSELFQAIACADAWEMIRVLFQVPYEDLVSLVRLAAVVVQPSRFEGWSTMVQDAKALGRPLLCSDLPVHREQAPEALGFFGCDDGSHLASLLAASWDQLEPGPQAALETKALAQERDFTRQHGQSLLAICKEAHSMRVR
jgi:glycosyltransferase involved in cell wall biosynthesis